ncbi:hypothetical protein [Terrisporobacter sp.]|uniref:ParM/StbA family protein n=1 Tax=Terrisporobacter sp. TaxID=1965305 RepID=UPI00289EB071|nr:hypothetical protein [Terrisporobacter sp.]
MKQKLGIDIGRGYVKGHTEYMNIVMDCMFKSVVAQGREIDFTDYIKEGIEPIFITSRGDFNFKERFVGVVAETDGELVIANSADDKTTEVVQQLLLAAMDKLTIVNSENKAEVEIMLGVPNRAFKKSTLDAVQAMYKGKEVTIINHIDETEKVIKISDIAIFRESDAALWYEMNQNNPHNGKNNVMVNIGFETSEIAFYDEHLKFIDLKSKSEPYGHNEVLKFVEKKLENQEIYKTLAQIDNLDKYTDFKEIGYKNFSDKLDQLVASRIGNLSEVNLYLCGGIAKKLTTKTKFNIVDDPQRITSKGLFLIATRKFR